MKNPEYCFKIETIRNNLLGWGKTNLRIFPWRNTNDPYKILIAEVMLHRTKAAQVEEIYESFILKYPDFESIAKAGPEIIKSELHPLGLFWRADMLYELAKIIVNSDSGQIPTNKKELMKLPGVGDYIASAVLCFSYEKPEPILDTNTVRVIGRVFGIEINDSSRRNKKFQQIMFDIINCRKSKKISLLMIDLASLICIAGHNQNHSQCPLNNVCNYYEKL